MASHSFGLHFGDNRPPNVFFFKYQSGFLSRGRLLSPKKTRCSPSVPSDEQFPCGSKPILVTETYVASIMCYAGRPCADYAICQRFSPQYIQLLLQVNQASVCPRLNLTSYVLNTALGKNTQHSYNLVRRLQEKKPTMDCSKATHCYVFTNTGVERVTWEMDSDIEALRDPALVNINPQLTEVPPPFCPSPDRLCRVVVATTLNPAHIRV
jgi:hypothetical protein